MPYGDCLATVWTPSGYYLDTVTGDHEVRRGCFRSIVSRECPIASNRESSTVSSTVSMCSLIVVLALDQLGCRFLLVLVLLHVLSNACELDR